MQQTGHTILVITCPRNGQIEDVKVARLFANTLPKIVSLAIDAHRKAAFDSNDLTITCDLCVLSSDLHAQVLSETLKRDDIVSPDQESDEADNAVNDLNVEWRHFVFGESPAFLDLDIDGKADKHSITLRVETPP